MGIDRQKEPWEEQRFSEAYKNKKYLKEPEFKLIKYLEFNTILDVGCARGGFLSLINKNKRRTGIDISKKMIELNKKELPDIKWFTGYIQALPFDECSFDLVTCQDVLIHLNEEDCIRSLDELFRVTKEYLLIKIRTSKDGKTYYLKETEEYYEAPFNIFGSDFLEHIENRGTIIKKIEQKSPWLKKNFPSIKGYKTTLLIKI